MTGVLLDRSNSKRASLFAVEAGFVLVSSYAWAGWVSNRLSGGNAAPDFSAAVLLPLLPWSVFRSKASFQLFIEGLVFLFIGAIIKDKLGSTISGFLAQWLLFSLGFYRMERADYAEQTKSADPIKLPHGKI
ncbi:MAG: hypothetical protein WCK51_05195 [Armatimonadota bacterium]